MIQNYKQRETLRKRINDMSLIKLTLKEQQIVLDNKELVHLLINRYYQRRLEQTFKFKTRDDLDQAGMEALSHAVRDIKEKPDDVAWSTFASKYIARALIDEVYGTAERAGERQIRVPLRTNWAIDDWNKAYDELTQKLKRFPYPEELAEYLEWPEEFEQKIQQWNEQIPQSYETLAEQKDENDNSPVDFAQNVFDDENSELNDPFVIDAICAVWESSMLSEREKMILARSIIGKETYDGPAGI